MGMKFVILIVIVLAVIAIAQIMRVYELSSKIRGKREEDVNLRVNNINASLMMIFLIVFFGSFFYMLAKYGRGMLPDAASEIGVQIDWLFNVNWWIVIFMFMFTNALLFGFAWKYSYHPDRKAHWFPHDNKLELAWTVVPAAILAVIIILGLITWVEITGKPSDDAKIVEIYGKQFNWTARYAGDDNKLGFSDYKLVGTYEEYSNPLGVITANHMAWKVADLNAQISDLYESLENENLGNVVYTEANINTMISKVEKLERIRERVIRMEEMYGDSVDAYAMDDYMATELFLVKDQEYQFILRSQDVLHSAYFPHFRAQMNCVPGQRTTLRVKPIYTTEEMRAITENPTFNYILLCNKICGVSHSQMKMAVTVGTQAEFDEWMADPNKTTKIVNDTLVAPSGINRELRPMPKPAHHGGDHGDHGEGHGDDHNEGNHGGNHEGNHEGSGGHHGEGEDHNGNGHH